MEVRHITWKRALAYGWGGRTATVTWTNDRTGRRQMRADRLVRGVGFLMRAFARQGRTPQDIEITRTVGRTRYVIGFPRTPACKRCGRETWDLSAVGTWCRDARSCVRRGRNG